MPDTMPPADSALEKHDLITRLRRSSAIAACLAVLIGCQTTPVRPTDEARPEEAAQAAQETGEYVITARQYERLAQNAPPPLKQQYLMNAVEALIKGGHLQTARTKLDAISVAGLDPSIGAQKRVLEARLVLAEHAPQRALNVLDTVTRTPNLTPNVLADLYEVRAQAELEQGRPLNAVRNYTQRERYVAGDAAAENQKLLWRVLESMPADRLRTELVTATQDPVLAGWIELALAVQENAGNGAAISQALAQWRGRYPAHPIGKPLLDSLTLGVPIFIGKIERIALLLPLTSDYAVAAQAVRDGFLAEHATTPEAQRPKVVIYDLGPTPALAPQVYERAVREGAQIVVGPLGREAADAIVHSTGLSVPTLLLSHTDERPVGPARLFQFGLPPEQEARQAAERAYLDGCRQAGVLYPSGAWGERMAGAFGNHWQRLGALVLASQPYAESDTDYSEPIKRLLNITESESRKSAIEKRLGQSLTFEPRPRQDIECIFLAANARSARLIKPQLNYFRARNVPVYSTSHIYSGKPDPVHDADLDGIRFGDMPWMLVQNGRIAERRQALQRDWPYAGTDLDRLYALGVDAYAVLPHLNRISAEASARFPGVTSAISVDREGRLHRQLAWARFRNGAPRLIDDPR
ncbi:MAG: penicillin-binding protein activator [Sulfurifustis sp.]